MDHGAGSLGITMTLHHLSALLGGSPLEGHTGFGFMLALGVTHWTGGCFRPTGNYRLPLSSTNAGPWPVASLCKPDRDYSRDLGLYYFLLL
jgi:hypothetical protein